MHQNGANVTADEVRVSFNCGYLPAWFNHRIMGGHQPTFPANYDKMPEAVCQFLPRVTGYDRDDAVAPGATAASRWSWRMESPTARPRQAPSVLAIGRHAAPSPLSPRAGSF